MWYYQWRLAYYREKLILAIVWKLPRWIVYWASIRLMAHATTNEYGSDSPHDVNIMTALERW